MALVIYRAAELFNTPKGPKRPASRGLFNVGKSLFYEEIEPRLEKVALGPKAVGYTDRSVEAIQAEMIAAASERCKAQRRDSAST
jgi:hypothetical protein